MHRFYFGVYIHKTEKIDKMVLFPRPDRTEKFKDKVCWFPMPALCRLHLQKKLSGIPGSLQPYT